MKQGQVLGSVLQGGLIYCSSFYGADIPVNAAFLWLFFFFHRLNIANFFLISVGYFREERRKEVRGRMIPVVASGTPVTVWKLLLIKPVLIFKVKSNLSP